MEINIFKLLIFELLWIKNEAILEWKILKIYLKIKGSLKSGSYLPYSHRKSIKLNIIFFIGFTKN